MSKIMFINDWLNNLSEIGIVIAILFGLVVIFVKRYRLAFGRYLFNLSFLLGATLWLFCGVTLLVNGSLMWLIIGFLLGGLGVVPVSMISMTFHHEWRQLGAAAFQLVLLFLFRVGGLALANHEEEKARKNAPLASEFFDELASEDAAD